MGLSGLVLVYIMVWIVLFFMALPLGISVPSKQEVGVASSAPSRPMIGKKILWVSLISFLLVGGMEWFIQKTHFPLRQWLTN